MAAKDKVVPETMTAPESWRGPDARRSSLRCRLQRARASPSNLPGHYPAGEGDGVHVGKDMSVVDEALRALKEKIDGVPSPATIRRVRAKLKLSQREAGAILKVGQSAFDKYERGLVEPSGPTAQLIKVLDRHPEIADELR